jgi:hypothetical protein
MCMTCEMFDDFMTILGIEDRIKSGEPDAKERLRIRIRMFERMYKPLIAKNRKVKSSLGGMKFLYFSKQPST